MPITPTNISKNTITPVGGRKTGIYLWGDVLATWGDSMATWGDSVATFVNQSKSSLSAFLELQDGTNFLLQDGGTLEMQGGSGALVYTNQSKN